MTTSNQLLNYDGNSMLDRSPPILLDPSAESSSSSSRNESNNNKYYNNIENRDSSTPELVSDSEYGKSERSPTASNNCSPISILGTKKISPNFGNLGDSLRAHELRQNNNNNSQDAFSSNYDSNLNVTLSNESQSNEIRLPSSINSSVDQHSQTLAKIYSAIGSLEYNSFSEQTDVVSSRKDLVSCIQKKRNNLNGKNTISLKSPPSVTFELNKNENTNEYSKVNNIAQDIVLPNKEEEDSEASHIETKEVIPSNKTDKKARKTKKKVKITSEPIEMFRPSCDAYTPRINQKKNIPYKHLAKREPQAVTTMGSISRPNFSDVLRRVAMIIHQHILKIERRFGDAISDSKLFLPEMRYTFAEENFATPTYKCTTIRVPMARTGVIYSLQKVHIKYNIPTVSEIYDFAYSLFQKVQLSSECSIVCLIYVERLMELAKVPLLADTWRPIFMCGLLLASKVWQDLSSWNIEFSNVYPQYSLDAISRMETKFLKMVKWDLYISSSLYAKYYFALRSLVEKKDFRQRYNQMVGVVGSVDAREALKIQRRTEMVKEVALSQYSRSM